MNDAAKKQELQTWDDRPAPAVILTPMALLDKAVSAGADIVLLERLMALQERYEANQARKAFDDAISNAKAEIPPIIKNRTVAYAGKSGTTGTSYRHEDLAEIARTVDPILSKHGLSYRWRTKSPVGQPIEVTCVVSHRLGHFEENTLVAGRDESGSKNAIQSIGSTLSYLQRYSLKAALGLAASNDDDGSKSEPEEAIESEQFGVIKKLLAEAGTDEAKFCQHFKIEALADLPASKFERAVGELNAAIEWQKKAKAKGPSK